MRGLLLVAALLFPRAIAPGPLAAPRALAGTDVDRQDPRRHIDYFLCARGEVPLAALAERAEAVATGAGALLERYVKLRAAEQRREPLPGETLESRLARLHELRVAALGPDLAESLFGQEEAVAALALARRRGEVTPLAPAERAAILPVATMLEERGLPPAEVHALRVARFGEAGAARLAELDRRRRSAPKH
jgi:lipase chaperone LimK